MFKDVGNFLLAKGGRWLYRAIVRGAFLALGTLAAIAFIGTSAKYARVTVILWLIAIAVTIAWVIFKPAQRKDSLENGRRDFFSEPDMMEMLAFIAGTIAGWGLAYYAPTIALAQGILLWPLAAWLIGWVLYAVFTVVLTAVGFYLILLEDRKYTEAMY